MLYNPRICTVQADDLKEFEKKMNKKLKKLEAHQILSVDYVSSSKYECIISFDKTRTCYHIYDKDWRE